MSVFIATSLIITGRPTDYLVAGAAVGGGLLLRVVYATDPIDIMFICRPILVLSLGLLVWVCLSLFARPRKCFETKNMTTATEQSSSLEATDSQLIKNFPQFLEPKFSLSCSQEPILR
jgi:esterase/lipase